MSSFLLVAATFVACAVEMVEALTIVLAVGVTRRWRCSRWVSCDASHVGTIFFLQTVARAGEGDGHGAGRGVEQARNFGILFSFEKPEGKHLSDFRIEAGEGAAQPVADLAGGARQ